MAVLKVDSKSAKDDKDKSIKQEDLALAKETFKKVTISDFELIEKTSQSLTNGTNQVGSHVNQSKIRFYICTLALLALTTSQMSRMVLNQSITVMVPRPMKQTQTNLVTNSTDTSNQFKTTTTTTTTTNSELNSTIYLTTSTSLFEDKQVFDDMLTTTELISPIETEKITPTTDEPAHETFNWNNDKTSTLLGGFYYGYFIFMIPGGRIAEAYGAKYVLLASVAGSAMVNLATPWMSRTNFNLLVSSRFILGALQAGVIPAMYALFNEWLTISETSIFAPLIKMNLRLGMMFGSALCGWFGYTWPLTFYSTGVLCAVWSIIWILLATSKPDDNRWVNVAELNHIKKKKRKEANKQIDSIEDGKQIEMTNKKEGYSEKVIEEKKKESEGTPWLSILTHPSIVALIVIKLAFNYAVDFLVILLPSYLAKVHKAEPQIVSYITIPMFGIQAVLIVFVGWFAKYVVKERPYKLSKTSIRKIFQFVTNIGMGICMILLTFNNYNLIYVAIILQLISFLSMFSAGGDTMLPYDLSDKYPATIMAIANCIGNISGVTTNEVSRVVLRGQTDSYEQWNKLIYLVAGVNIIGCLIFMVLVKAERIEFNKRREEKSNKNEATVLPVAVHESAANAPAEGKSGATTESMESERSIESTKEDKQASSEQTIDKSEVAKELDKQKES